MSEQRYPLQSNVNTLAPSATSRGSALPAKELSSGANLPSTTVTTGTAPLGAYEQQQGLGTQMAPGNVGSGFAGSTGATTTTQFYSPSPRETVEVRETIFPGSTQVVYGRETVQETVVPVKEAAIVTNFQEQPIVVEVIEKPSLEVHRQQHITEIHEKPQVVFQEQPMIVQERMAPEFRRISEQIVTEDNRALPQQIANPYLNMQPHLVRQQEIRTEVADQTVMKQVIEKPSMEVHQQPIITEVIEKPMVEIHEQEVIRKFRDAPVVVRSTSPSQYISAEQARAMGIQFPLETQFQQVAITQPPPQPRTVILQEPSRVLTEEIHTITHPLGHASVPVGAEIVSTTDPSLKQEVGHVHTGTTGTASSPGIIGKVKNMLGGHKTANK